MPSFNGFCVDPFTNDWHDKFELQTSKAELVLEMIKFYMLLDQDGSSASRNKMVKEFEASRFFQFLRKASMNYVLTIMSPFAV